MNHMSKVAEMLGVELNEEFHIKDTADTYILDEYGLSVIFEGHNERVNASDFLTLLLSGQLEAIVFDLEHYVLGNCFKSEEEAEKHKDKDKYIEWLRSKKPDTSWRD